MKKRFLCALLTLIMLVSLVPTTALTASAASMVTSESAITVLKQWNGYKSTCGADGNTGYGTKCTVKATHGAHTISEKQADEALRTHLKGLETAVNSFASKNGVALSQNKFDALILFSFDNGTAWTTGTGSIKSAVMSGLKGTEFLNVICRWNISKGDDKRRMVEANMYLNGVYSSVAPYNYILLEYDAKEGSLNGASSLQYYDTTETRTHAINPTRDGYIFLGWYVNDILAYEVSSRYTGSHVLEARWQKKDATNGFDNGNVVYTVKKTSLSYGKIYTSPNGDKLSSALFDKLYKGLGDNVTCDRDFIDKNNKRWLHIAGSVSDDKGAYDCWFILGDAGAYGAAANTKDAVATAVVNVSANNGYVNVRSGAGTNNTIVGAIANGTHVTILETKYVNGHQWGRVSNGWFCLTYAKVTWLKKDTSYTTDAGLLSYVLTGKLKTKSVYTEINGALIDAKNIPETTATITITHLKAAPGETWGKIAQGWVNLANVNLDVAQYIVTADTVTVRENPGLEHARKDTLVKGVEFNANDFKVVNETIWAHADKIGAEGSMKTYDGWVELSNAQVARQNMPTLEDSDSNVIFTNKMATVVGTDNLNVREYNDATYAKIGSLSRGSIVAVWEEEDGWYKVDSNKNSEYDYEDDGWVSGKYLEIYDSKTPTSGNTSGSASGSVETGMGVIANTYTGVNVRTGAGTGYAATGKILAGSTVEILEVKSAGASKWGRVAQGWICMDYVTMVSKYPVSGTTGNTGSANGTTSNTTASESVIFTGKVNAPSVDIYKSSNSKSEIARTLVSGDPITVHELLIAEESTVTEDPADPNKTITVTEKKYWARTNDGYILDPVDNIVLNPLAEKTYTVTSYEENVHNELKVYESDLTTVKAGPTLNKYEQVTVTVLKIKGIELWCRVEFSDHDGFNQDGYVNMKYLTLGTVQDPDKAPSNGNTGSTAPQAPVIGNTGNTANQGNNGYVNNTSGYRYTGKVIRTNTVNVRANPSQTAALTTTLKSGAAMVIYETVVNEGMAWGRCDAGWVYLYYVDLQPCNTAVDAKVVYNENTIIYTDANCSEVAGTYARMSVVDIYEQVGSMCRTEQGWVHIDNLG